ncbi:MAG: helix-turn-helix transcriptional regulator [Rhodospirillaceae bacterium]
MTTPPPHARRIALPGLGTLELLPASGYEAHYRPAHGVIGFGFDAQRGVHAFGSDRRRPYLAPPNQLSWVPGGCDVFSRSDSGGEYLCLTFETPRSSLPDRRIGAITHRDPLGRGIALARQFRQILLSDASPDPLALEQAALTLEDILIDPLGEVTAPEARRMTTQRWRLFTDRVEAELGSTLRLEALAAELGLSAAAFSRMVKAACGQSPHSYIMDRRIARARALILQGATSLADIAVQTGFSSQAHMATAFRKRLGLSPSAFRTGLSGL